MPGKWESFQLKYTFSSPPILSFGHSTVLSTAVALPITFQYTSFVTAVLNFLYSSLEAVSAKVRQKLLSIMPTMVRLSNKS